MADWAAFRLSATFEAAAAGHHAVRLLRRARAARAARWPAPRCSPGPPCCTCCSTAPSNQERTSRWAGGHRRQGRWSLVGTGVGDQPRRGAAGAIAGPRLPGADADALRRLARPQRGRAHPGRAQPHGVAADQAGRAAQRRGVHGAQRAQLVLAADRARRVRRRDLAVVVQHRRRRRRAAAGARPRHRERDRRRRRSRSTRSARCGCRRRSSRSPSTPAPDQTVDFDQRSSTLMVDRDVATSDGYTYTVTSAVPDWTAAELRTASDRGARRDRDAATRSCPSDFPQQARDRGGRDHPGRRHALRQGAGPAGLLPQRALHLRPAGRAGAQQPRADDVPVRDPARLLRAVLGRVRRPGPVASASRSRVAVGFTPGVQDSNDPTLFRVRGVHAHAWPEVYLGEYGWVPFEPTPDRGPPRAQSGSASPSSRTRAPAGAAGTDPDLGGADGRRHRDHVGGRRRAAATPEPAWARVRRQRRGRRRDQRSVPRPRWPTTSCRPPPSASWPTSSSSRSPSSPSRWCGAGGPARPRTGCGSAGARRPRGRPTPACAAGRG